MTYVKQLIIVWPIRSFLYTGDYMRPRKNSHLSQDQRFIIAWRNYKAAAAKAGLKRILRRDAKLLFLQKRRKGAKSSMTTLKETIAYMQSLGIQNHKQWQVIRDSGLVPDDIPTNPDQHFKGRGWKSWAHSCQAIAS